ncbi:MAG: tRNA (adenosine(37)-N6)-threonylcarbamoyltransferase complex dimerization subunit type 1 TsaB [Caldilineaceae bacterium]|nr:tRNA (adenosine(37)-N6)-threonylcarbamoyltransferase complex dimerization subunit type 1 TsaB [Caldilineaceae bacterium]HRJ41157.1 tRNA (adenosine(37)-N6)-threonylcarbamoyltransferase complex dimerization subunit type 1 TsaB [Caldilineaceae bacterium]
MLLALDTATNTASVALYDQSADLLLAEQTWQARRRQTEETIPVIQEMLARLEIGTQQIDALAVTTGPGSFTGVRIAISVVKGIALGLDQTPAIIGLPALCVTAGPFFAPAQSTGATICAFLQAGRGRYNWAFFPPGSELYRPGADEHGFGKIDAFQAGLTAQPQPLWLVGETTAEVRDSVADLPHTTLLDGVSGLRRAGMLARLGALHLAAGHADGLDSLEPLYLREP